MTTEFEKWQKQWDAAAEQFAQDYSKQIANKQEPTIEPSWLTNTPLDRDYQEKPLEDEPDWRDIYYRSQNIEGMINEVKYDNGPEKPKANFGAFTPTKTNPTMQSTTGADGLADAGGVRVTKNWTGSEDLAELDEIKRKLEQIERKHHEEEVRTEKPSKLKKELESLRDRIKKLSEKINIEPEVDVT